MHKKLLKEKTELLKVWGVEAYDTYFKILLHDISQFVCNKLKKKITRKTSVYIWDTAKKLEDSDLYLQSILLQLFAGHKQPYIYIYIKVISQ